MDENNSQVPTPPETTVSENVGGGQALNTLPEVAKKIQDSENVLVALSSDPSVDEMAAALALTLALDSLDKHATAIYSGKTPNVLEFLNPGATFETNTNSLQDFIIALNKEKADHLRYKIDGDYVKVFITPYKTTLSEDDLEFSRGEFNVDLVISINVPAATDLDGALREHGRIMHDATAINITNGAAGKFGDLEWVDGAASSLSEMVAQLIFALTKNVDAATATALFTGLVAATDKFSNPATTPEVLLMAAKLMKMGADQQEVFRSMSQELEMLERDNETLEIDREEKKEEKKDASEFDVSHKDGEAEEEKKEEESEKKEVAEEPDEAILDASERKTETPEETVAEAPAETGSEGAEAPAETGAEQASETPEGTEATDGGQAGTQASSFRTPEGISAPQEIAEMPAGAEAVPAGNVVAGVEVGVAPASEGYSGGSVADQILNNLSGAEAGAMPAPEAQNVGTPGTTDYGKMIDAALAEPLPGETPAGQMMQQAGSALPPEQGQLGGAMGAPMSEQGQTMMNPAMAQAPAVDNLPAPEPLPMPETMTMPGELPPVNPSPLPMPGQEMVAPMTPTPDFSGIGQLPQVQPEMQGMGGQVGMEQAMSLPEVQQPPMMGQPAGMPTIQGAGAPISSGEQPLPQDAQASAGVPTGEQLIGEQPDPNAFRIPGITT